jgi:DNA-binding transcriptional LysR family regulator
VDDISREVADINQGHSGLLRIGANARLAVDLLPDACKALLIESPRVTLKIVLGETKMGAPALSRGELDMYLTANTLSGHDDLVQEQLFSENWVVVASSRHRLARKKQLTLADLVQERWVLGLYGPAQADLFRAFAENALPAPIVAVEVNAMLFRRELVSATDMLTFGPRQFFRENASRTGVAELPVKGLSSPRGVSACYRKDAYLSPLVRRFIEILKSTAKKMAPSSRIDLM